MEPKKVRGTLKVLLESAQGLKKKDCSSDLHPYAILTCGFEKKESTAAKGHNPEWNEKFSFDIYCGVQELAIKVMDKHTCHPDDFLAEAKIDLGPLIKGLKILTPTMYKLHPCGEIKVVLEFTPILTGSVGEDMEPEIN